MKVHLTPDAAAAQLRALNKDPFVVLLQHGNMSVEYFAPVEVDLQTPHQQDELYVIASGYGYLNREGHRIAVTKGDVLFVPAGMEHRFEKFSEDFATWVIFYGPQGGERSADQ